MEEEEEDAVEKSPVFVIPPFHAVSSLVESYNGQQSTNNIKIILRNEEVSQK